MKLLALVTSLALVGTAYAGGEMKEVCHNRLDKAGKPVIDKKTGQPAQDSAPSIDCTQTGRVTCNLLPLRCGFSSGMHFFVVVGGSRHKIRNAFFNAGP